MTSNQIDTLVAIWQQYVGTYPKDITSKALWRSWLATLPAADYETVNHAINTIGEAHDATAKFPVRPNLMTLQKEYRNRKRTHRANSASAGEGCPVCRFTGLVQIVYVRIRGKSYMLPRDKIFPSNSAAVIMKPCICDMGRIQNDANLFKHDQRHLQRIAERYAFDSSTKAWAAVIACRDSWLAGNRDQ